MLKKILAVLVLLGSAALSSAQTPSDFVGPDGSYTILKDSQGRTIFGMGTRPTPNQNLGISTGMPFYDAPTTSWYWYTGTAWTPPSQSLSGATLSGPVLLSTGAVGAPALSFAADPTDGFYRSADNQITWATGGADRWTFQNFNFTPASDDGLTIASSNRVLGIGITRWIQGSKSKTLTDAAAATPVIRVPVATSGYQAGEVIWNAQSTDAADFRTTAGRIRFAGVNKAAVLTCTVNVIGTDLTASSNANTLVCTWTNVVNTTNCDLSVTCTDNTAGSQTMTINVRADMPTAALTISFP